MLWFKNCPKCRGDIYLDHDLYGDYVTCLQCGYTSDYPPRTPDYVLEEGYSRHIVRGSLKWSSLRGTKYTLPR